MERENVKKPQIYDAALDILLPVERIWDVLTRRETIETMTGCPVRSDITGAKGKGNGVLVVGKAVFYASFTPYEAELSGSQAKIRLRVTSSGKGCRIAVAAALAPESSLDLNSDRLKGFLAKFNDVIKKETEKQITLQSKETYRQSGNDRTETSKINIIEQKQDPDNIIRFKAQSANQQSEYSVKRKSRAGGRVLVVIMLLAVLLALAAAGYSRLRDMMSSTDTSGKITLQNAKSISIGMTKNQISFKLGTNGIVAEENRVVYRSATEADQKWPTRLISVIFNESDMAKSVSFLDLSAATSVFMIVDFTADVVADMSIEEVADQLGLPLSLYRRYDTEDGKIIEEVHFGYLDPTANFNPAWRGEFEIIFNRTDNSVEVKNWGSYDGSDPTMIGSIEGTPFANQYDDYTDFLNDRFQFSRSQLLLNRYSLGDTKFFFDGVPEHYSNDFGYQFYNVDSKEKVPDTDMPLYRISVGYDNKGAFRMASFSNMRLYNKAGTLKDSGYRMLTRGMSYSEVRSLMRLVPTTIYIDEHYYSVCYGRFLNTEVADEQFEVIIRFDLENSLAQKVLDNTAVSSVTDVN